MTRRLSATRECRSAKKKSWPLPAYAIVFFSRTSGFWGEGIEEQTRKGESRFAGNRRGEEARIGNRAIVDTPLRWKTYRPPEHCERPRVASRQLLILMQLS